MNHFLNAYAYLFYETFANCTRCGFLLFFRFAFFICFVPMIAKLCYLFTIGILCTYIMYDNNILIKKGFTSGKHTKIEKGKCKNNKKMLLPLRFSSTVLLAKQN